MNAKSKANRAGIIFILLLIVSGVVLMYRGNDATILAMEKKEGILTAEQIKLAFDSVSGRMVTEAVKEGQQVSAGDLIMELDATDTDLSIERLKAQISQLDAQINSTSGSMGLNLFKARNDEQQSFRQIDSQRALVDSAKATLTNAEIDYNRKLELVNSGAIAKSQLDDATMALNVAKANVQTQQQALERLWQVQGTVAEQIQFHCRQSSRKEQLQEICKMTFRHLNSRKKHWKFSCRNWKLQSQD